MDDIALQTLAQEMRRDCEVAAEALQTANTRVDEGSPASLDSCAFHLARLFNIVEQMSLRVAKAFENNIDDEKGWHTELIRRMSLTIPGVRPALFSQDILQPMHELRAFRHVFNHAYDLRLDPDKLRLLLKYAHAVLPRLDALRSDFMQNVAEMHDLTPPDEGKM